MEVRLAEEAEAVLVTGADVTAAELALSVADTDTVVVKAGAEVELAGPPN